MRSDTIAVSSHSIAPALDFVEKTAQYIGYSAEYSARMRLLGEELVSSIKSILDDVEASLWMETDQENMSIHLKLEGVLSELTRDRLVDLSKKHRNEPHKGVFARIGAFFSDAFLTDANGYVPLMMNGDSTMYVVPVSIMEIAPVEQPADDAKGVESNILRGMADDIKVCARSTYAELIVIKKLPNA